MPQEAEASTLNPSAAARVLWAPVLAPLLRTSPFPIVLAIGGAAQVGLTLANVGGMPCPFMHLTGVPCPGCGLSRACAALLRGQWMTAARFHVFSPLFLIAIVLFIVAAVLPQPLRDRLAGRIEQIERRTLIVNLLLVLFMLYWLARLVYAPVAFGRLVGSGI